jgi:hypothetical protein
MALVPPDAHLSCYSSVATTFYPTLVFEGYEAHYKQCALLAESAVLENLLPCINTTGVVQHK